MDLRRARRRSFKEKDVEKRREKKKYRHDMVLEMEMKSEDMMQRRIFDSIPTYRADRRATEFDDGARVFEEVKRR